VIRVFNKFPELKRRPYWGNHFWARAYCVDTVGLDTEKIRAYVLYQEKEGETSRTVRFRLLKSSYRKGGNKLCPLRGQSMLPPYTGCSKTTRFAGEFFTLLPYLNIPHMILMKENAAEMFDLNSGWFAKY
jgi:hypothetical protein